MPHNIKQDGYDGEKVVAPEFWDSCCGQRRPQLAAQDEAALVAERDALAQVVTQHNGLDQIFIAAQGTRNRASNLGHLQRVGEPRAIIIAFVIDKNLRFIFETSESGCMQDTVSVTLKGCPIIRFIFLDDSPFGNLTPCTIWRQSLVFEIFQLHARI